MFPPFVLAKLYVKGTLKNTDHGFEFALKNMVDSGTLVELGPITVGEKVYTAAALTVVTGGQEKPGDQVTRANPMPVYMGSSFVIRVSGDPLPAGEQTINVSVLTREIGRLKFDIKDSAA